MTTQEKPIQGINEMEFRQAATAFLAASFAPSAASASAPEKFATWTCSPAIPPTCMLIAIRIA